MSSTSDRIQSNRYHLVGRMTLDNDGPSTRVWYCRECGVLVGSQTVHNQWHRFYRKVGNGNSEL